MYIIFYIYIYIECVFYILYRICIYTYIEYVYKNMYISNNMYIYIYIYIYIFEGLQVCVCGVAFSAKSCS